MSSKGLTLIEIIVSTLIIVAISAGTLGAFFGGHQLMNRSRHRLQALNFAREALDTLRSNYRYDSAQMSEGSHDESKIGGNIIRGEMENLPPDLPDLPLAYNVTEVAGGYKELKVSVKWKEAAFY